MRRCAHALVALVIAGASLVVTGSPAAAESFVHSVDAVFSPAPGQLRLYGWAYDDDSVGESIAIHVYVGGGAGSPGAVGYPLMANLPRPDVSPYPHGFDNTLQVPLHGPQPVYIYAINVDQSPGANALIWQGTVTIANPPPDTSITAAPPAQGTDPSVTFGFGATEPSSFTCRWDQGAWQACASPVTATVAVGAHTFAVRATDLAGAPDPSPASYGFTVTAPPAPPPVVVPPPPQPPSGITLRLRAVRKESRLKVDVGPDLNPSNYRFNVQRRTGRTWRTVRRTQTLGPRDVMVLNLRRGKYRVVVPRQHDLAGTSATVRLRR